jgi:hypothetical protein
MTHKKSPAGSAGDKERGKSRRKTYGKYQVDTVFNGPDGEQNRSTGIDEKYRRERNPDGCEEGSRC